MVNKCNNAATNAIIFFRMPSWLEAMNKRYVHVFFFWKKMNTFNKMKQQPPFAILHCVDYMQVCLIMFDMLVSTPKEGQQGLC
mmetsp:Transcript_92952/g.161087  ORF Transcript_92952/g.161087 Transcript_92952/m.161087 type:complete len:83 (-) Transcript_92952:2318-2566(-)